MQTEKIFGVDDRQLEPNILSIVNGIIGSIFLSPNYDLNT